MLSALILSFPLILMKSRSTFASLWQIALLVALPSLGFGQAMDLSTPLPQDPAVRTGTLPNGLRYYIRQNKKPEKRAELRLVVNAGSVLENDDQRGLAHFVEHMSFNGTKEFPKAGLVNFLESNGIRFGADLNAYTSFDETVYMLKLPTDRKIVLDSGLDVLSEWAHNVAFDSTEFEKERGVVGEEWRLGRGAQGRIFDKQLPVIAKGSKYAERNTIGMKPTIDTAHLSTIKSFYQTWYRPDLMAVVAVGDFDPVEMEQAIKARFTPIPNPSAELPRPKITIPMHSETLASVATDKEMPYTIFTLSYARPEPKQMTVSDYRHQLAIGLYDQMVNARLQEAIQKGAPIAYASASDGQFFGGLQAYSAFAVLKPDSVLAGEAALLREVFRAKQHGFNQSELDRAKKNLVSGMEKVYSERAKTESSSYIREYTSNFLHAEAFPGIEYEYALHKKYVPTISLQEVNALSSELLENASPVITYSGVESAKTAAPTETQLLATLAGVQKENLASYKDNVITAPLIKSLPKAGKVTDEKTIAGLGITEWKLSNGARVLIKPTDFKDDEILFSAFAPGGHSSVSDADFISADNSNGLIDNSGVADFDASSLSKLLAGKNVQVSPFVSALQDGFSGSSTKQDLPTLFELTHAFMTTPRLDSAGALSFMAQQRAFLENRGKDPQSVANDTLEVALYQNHVRAQPTTLETLNHVDFNKAYQYFKSHFSDGGNFTYLFVGNVDTKTLKPLVEKYLASVPAQPKHASWRDVGMTNPNGIVKKAVYKGAEDKTFVTMVFPGQIPFSRENRYKLSATAQAIEMKLREDLREDKSGVYFVSVAPSISKYPHEKYNIRVVFSCDPKRADELITEVMNQLDTISRKGLPATYADKVKEISRRELETNLKHNNYWLSKMQDAVWNDIDMNTIDKGQQLIDSFGAKDVQEYANKYFNRNNYVQVVLYPDKKS
jgi:zinc protease